MIESSRRGFITGLISLVAAPAIVRVTNIMPVKRIVLPRGNWVSLRAQEIKEKGLVGDSPAIQIMRNLEREREAWNKWYAAARLERAAKIQAFDWRFAARVAQVDCTTINDSSA